MKRKTYNILFLILLAGLFFAQNSFAAKKAVFPDSSALQPPASNAHPNISGNVNFSEGESGQVMPSQNLPSQSLFNSGKTNVLNASKNIFNLNNLFWIIIIFMGLTAGFLYIKPKK